MRIGTAIKALFVLLLLADSSAAISLSCSSGGSEGESSIGVEYDLDSSTILDQSVTIGDGEIMSVQSAKGSGKNSIVQTASNQNAIVSSSMTSTDNLASTASSYASGDVASIGQTVQSSGQSESSISASSNSLDAEANQEAGVLGGAIATSQIAIAGDGSVSALQSSSIAGALGYANGEARSSDNTVKVTGGLNGIGDISGFIAAIASDSAKASGSLQADSLESKAYSAVKSTSEDGDVYSYLSSADQLASSLSGTADGHVTSNQDIDANGGVRVYASSTSDDSSSKGYDADGESVSGSLSALAGSPAVIETNLAGDIDIQSSTESLIPTPGSWVWNGLGGYITSNPFQLQADGKTHIFAKGGDNGLWDNYDGDWQGLGGVIDSAPFAAEDNLGKIHVFVKGSDGALWDRIFDGGWTSLGGYITSNPCAALSQDSNLKVFVKGGDNALWQKDLTTGDWAGLGGAIDSNPQAILDKDGKMHVLVKGTDEGLWDNVDGDWQARGGIITSDAKPAINPFDPGFIYTSVRGGDGSLWYNKLDTASDTANWEGLGGFILGTPAPVVDTDGVIHNFVRGGDGALWDNANGGWYSLGGYITSDPNAIRDKCGKLHVAAVGGDSALWVNTVGTDWTPTTLVGSFACDYKAIQDAVDAMNDDSIVKVLSGTYTENVNINKRLALNGAGADKTVVDGNKAGPVFTIGLSGDATISDMKIQNGQAERGGGICNKGKLTLNDFDIIANSATISGGGIYNAESGTLKLNSGKIDQNTVVSGEHHDGGGIDNWGTLELNRVNILSNTLGSDVNTGWGGGIAHHKGILNLEDGSSISDNVAYAGGGVWIDSVDPTCMVNMNGGSVERNTAQYGGGFDVWGTLNLNGGIICNNVATNAAESSEGGGIYVWGGNGNKGKLVMAGGKVYGNKAYNGGGINNAIGDGTCDSTVEINGGSIYENEAYIGGGGIENYGVLTMNGGSIYDNTAIEGGGIYNNAIGTLNLKGSTSISSNEAKKYGGGIYNKGTLNFEAGTIGYNVAACGGGIDNVGTNSKVYLKGGSIQNNEAYSEGGGIYNYFGTIDLISGSVDHNIAPSLGNGGGIYNDQGILTGDMSLVHDNQKDDIVPPPT